MYLEETENRFLFSFAMGKAGLVEGGFQYRVKGGFVRSAKISVYHLTRPECIFLLKWIVRFRWLPTLKSSRSFVFKFLYGPAVFSLHDLLLSPGQRCVLRVLPCGPKHCEVPYLKA